MDFFTWVGDLSGWYWLALGILLIALEMLVPSFVVIWPGLAAVVMAVLVAIFPNIGGEWLVVSFAVLSIAFIFIGRSFAIRLRKREPKNTLNARGKSLIDRHAKVVTFDQGEGRVTVSGIQWPAVWEDGQVSAVGDTVTITASTGVSLTVKNM